MKRFSLTPLFGDRRGFMPPLLKTTFVLQKYTPCVWLHYNCFKDGKWESDEKSFSGAQAVDLTGRYCVAVTCLLVLEVSLWVQKYQIST